MIKKILGLGVVLVMLFSLAACNTDLELESYKTDAKNVIQAHADRRQKELRPDNWTIYSDIVVAAKATVDVAESKTDVDTAVNDAKDLIDKLKVREDGLNSKIKSEIINWSYLYLDLGQKDGTTLVEIDNMCLEIYYGQYNGFHIFHFRIWGFGTHHETVIDNLSFISSGSSDILAVKEGCGMELKELYEGGHITRFDLEEIYNINNNHEKLG